MVFASPFFSRSGQSERLRNVGQTLTAAVTGRGVVANTPSATANRLLGAAASNPFVTALGGAAAAAPRAALGAVSSTFSALPAGGKVAVAIAAPVAAGAVVTNPSLIGKAATAPRELSRFGSDLASLGANPTRENLSALVAESPLIAGAAVVGAGVALGAAGRTVATIANTAALNRSVTGASALPASVPSAVSAIPATIMPAAGSTAEPITRETQVLGREPTAVGNRKPRKKAAAQPIRNTVRVQVLNQQTYIQRR